MKLLPDNSKKTPLRILLYIIIATVITLWGTPYLVAGVQYIDAEWRGDQNECNKPYPEFVIITLRHSASPEEVNQFVEDTLIDQLNIPMSDVYVGYFLPGFSTDLKPYEKHDYESSFIGKDDNLTINVEADSEEQIVNMLKTQTDQLLVRTVHRPSYICVTPFN